MLEAYKKTIQQNTLNDPTFVKMTLGGKVRGASPWRRIEIRLVELKGVRQWQFVYYDERQAFTKNYLRPEASKSLDDALALPFSTLFVQTAQGSTIYQISKKGKVLVQQNVNGPSQPPDLAHDRKKEAAFSENEANAFLEAVGITDKTGAIRSLMRDKFAQVNEFLKLLGHTHLEQLPQRPLAIVEAGSGSAYLTFALYDYLNNKRGIQATIEGLENRATLVYKSNRASAALGVGEHLHFTQVAIQDYIPATPPDVVIALHACDTATDDALALGIRAGASVIIAVPCCHHHLHEQLGNDPLRPIMRYGIMKKRMGDLLTDAFRALILRMAGYRCDVIEYVSSEHTDRNIMLRAVKTSTSGDATAQAEYEALKAEWNVVPYLENLSGLPDKLI